MCFQIHLRLIDIGLVGLTFRIEADEMSVSKVFFELGVVEVVLWVAAAIPPITDMAPLMSLSTVCVELVVTIKSLSTEPTLGVPPESRLIDRTWIVVSIFLMSPQLPEGEQLMFMCEDLLVSTTQVAHDFTMRRSDMPVQIGPSETCHVAVLVGTIISQ